MGISGNKIAGSIEAFGTTVGFVYDNSSWTFISDPLGTNGTAVNGIDGSTIVGDYTDSLNKVHGFTYDGSTYTTLDDPLGLRGTVALGISGKIIVGSYTDSSSKVHGFLYDGSTFTTIDNPLGSWTSLYGISGNSVVGTYSYAAENHGFVYAIPEPSTFKLLLAGAIALLVFKRRISARGNNQSVEIA